MTEEVIQIPETRLRELAKELGRLAVEYGFSRRDIVHIVKEEYPLILEDAESEEDEEDIENGVRIVAEDM